MKLKEVLEKQKAFEAELIIKSYENEIFRQDLLSDPKEVIEKETGKKIPEGIEIKVIEEEPNSVTIVLPRKPSKYETTEELSDGELEKVAGGNEEIPNPMAPYGLPWWWWYTR